MLRKIAATVAVVCIILVAGCESSSDDGGSGGDLAGTWSGNACGRGLTLNINQSGTSLSGSYSLTNPDFSESFSGTASGESAPATATLNGGGDRSFKIKFNSANSLSGGLYKGGSQVCSVSASK